MHTKRKLHVILNDTPKTYNVIRKLGFGRIIGKTPAGHVIYEADIDLNHPGTPHVNLYKLRGEIVDAYHVIDKRPEDAVTVANPADGAAMEPAETAEARIRFAAKKSLYAEYDRETGLVWMEHRYISIDAEAGLIIYVWTYAVAGKRVEEITNERYRPVAEAVQEMAKQERFSRARRAAPSERSRREIKELSEPPKKVSVDEPQPEPVVDQRAETADVSASPAADAPKKRRRHRGGRNRRPKKAAPVQTSDEGETVASYSSEEAAQLETRALRFETHSGAAVAICVPDASEDAVVLTALPGFDYVPPATNAPQQYIN